MQSFVRLPANSQSSEETMPSSETTPGRVEISVESLSEAIEGAMPVLDEADRKIAATIHRLMSLGKPVEPAAVGEAVGIDVRDVDAKLASWPGVYRDNGDRIVGFWGHAIAKLDPEYRLSADGQTTFAWCALDTLFIPGITGQTVRVEASDPLSGEPVSLVVDRDGVHELMPANASVSMVIPDGPFGYDVIESFCHRVQFFASEETGARWTTEHPDTTLLSVADAYEVGRALTARITRGVGE
jgi:alkylmercury lyase